MGEPGSLGPALLAAVAVAYIATSTVLLLVGFIRGAVSHD